MSRITELAISACVGMIVGTLVGCVIGVIAHEQARGKAGR